MDVLGLLSGLKKWCVESNVRLTTAYQTLAEVNLYSAGIDFSRQNLRQILMTKVDPRTVRVETISNGL